MSKALIIAICIGAAVLLAAPFVSIFTFGKILKDQNRVNEMNFELLSENIAQSETHFIESQSQMNRHIEQIFTEFNVVLERLDQLNTDPTIINTTTGTVDGDTVVVYIDNLDQIPRDFVFRTQDGMPVAFYTIDEDTETGEIEMATGTYDLTVKINTVVAYDNTGSPTVITETRITSAGEENIDYPVRIDESISYFTDPDPITFAWWDPHLDLGAGGRVDISDGSITGAASLGVSIMSYGSREEEIIRFVRAGIDFDGTVPYPSITPIMYNLGDTIPFLSDTWIGPTVGYSIDDEAWYVGALISSTL